MGFSRQEYWSGVPLPSPDLSLGVMEIKTKINKYIFKSNFNRFYCSLLVLLGLLLLANRVSVHRRHDGNRYAHEFMFKYKQTRGSKRLVKIN